MYILYISSRAFHRIFCCKIWRRYRRERALKNLLIWLKNQGKVRYRTFQLSGALMRDVLSSVSGTFSTAACKRSRSSLIATKAWRVDSGVAWLMFRRRMFIPALCNEWRKSTFLLRSPATVAIMPVFRIGFLALEVVEFDAIPGRSRSTLRIGTCATGSASISGKPQLS